MSVQTQQQRSDSENCPCLERWLKGGYDIFSLCSGVFNGLLVGKRNSQAIPPSSCKYPNAFKHGFEEVQYTTHHRELNRGERALF